MTYRARSPRPNRLRLEALERRELLTASPVGDAVAITPTTDFDQHAAVAFKDLATNDPNGDYVVVWTEDNGPNEEIHAQRYQANGTAVGDPIAVSEAPGAIHPAVAMDPDGDFVVAWIQQSGADKLVYARVFDHDGAPATSAFNAVSNAALVGNSTPDVAMDADGDFVITWASYTSYSPLRLDILARRFSADGTPAAAEITVDQTNQISSLPSVSMTDAGQTVVAWAFGATSASQKDIYARVFDSALSPESDQFLVNTAPTLSQTNPDVAVDGVGRFVVVWEGQDTQGAGVVGRRFSLEGPHPAPLSAEFLVNANRTAGDQRLPSVASGAAGAFSVTYRTNDNGNLDVQGFSFHDAPLPEGSLELVDSALPAPANLFSQPAIAADAGGDFVVVYPRKIGADFSTWHRRYAGLPTVVGVTARSSLPNPHPDYEVPAGSGEQLRTIPIGGFDTIAIHFDRPVDVEEGDLTVTGENVASYALASGGFSFDPATLTASWKFDISVAQADELTFTLADGLASGWGLGLDGEWANPALLSTPTSDAFPSGDGAAGGAFAFRVSRIPGDANLDGIMNGADFTLWAGGFGTADALFTHSDSNGDRQVNGADFTLWAGNFGVTGIGHSPPVGGATPPLAWREARLAPRVAPQSPAEPAEGAAAGSGAGARIAVAERSLAESVGPRVRRPHTERSLADASGWEHPHASRLGP